MGIPLFAFCVKRSYEDQKQMVLNGASRDLPNDGMWPHMGYAVDIIHSTLGYGLPDKGWLLLGHLGKEVAQQLGIKIVWGGDWKSLVDRPHWELADWKKRVQESILYE